MLALELNQATAAQEAPPTPARCWVWRQDRADEGTTWSAVRADDSGDELALPVEHPDGFWRTEGIVARPGILIYREGGREIRELVPDEVLHDPEHLALLCDVIVTNEHPPELVSRENQDQFNAGNLSGEPRVLSDGPIASKIILRDPELIEAVRSKAKTELSVGYRVEVENTPGTHPKYGAYDRVQTKRMPNHVAVVPRGRAGRTAAIRLDASGEVAPMPVASVSQPNLSGASGAAKENPVASVLFKDVLLLKSILPGLAIREDMSDEEIKAKVNEELAASGTLVSSLRKVLGTSTGVEELQNKLNAVQGVANELTTQLAQAKASEERYKQQMAEVKTELDSAKAAAPAPMVEPVAAVAQAMDGVMPPEGSPRLDAATEKAVRDRVAASLAKRERAAVVMKGVNLDAKALGLDVTTAPLAKLNRAIAERTDAAFAKNASDETIDVLLEVRATEIKKQAQSRLDGANLDHDDGLLGLSFDGRVDGTRNDAAEAGGASHILPTPSLYADGVHPLYESARRA